MFYLSFSRNLLTSRSVNHGMHNAINNYGGMQDPVCFGHLKRYDKNGYVDFVDGQVCEVSTK